MVTNTSKRKTRCLSLRGSFWKLENFRQLYGFSDHQIMLHTGFWLSLVSPNCDGELTVKLPFRTTGVSTTNMSDRFTLLLKVCLTVLFSFITGRGLNEQQQSHSRVHVSFTSSKAWRTLQLSLRYKSSSYVKTLAPSHLNVTTEKLLFCKGRQHPPQRAAHWTLPAASLCWPVTHGLTEHEVHLMFPCSSLPMDQLQVTTAATLLHI